ncbi:transposase [Streptomyces sp. NPDC058953]|uniref:transposase n=1 Tax=unclassified Streptomyces TaxID=2593676 RepID=UPI00368ADFC8
MRTREREPHRSDLSDKQSVLIDLMITAWRQDRVARSATGDPGACDLREAVNAIFYQSRTGCQWRYPPNDFPAWSAVFYYTRSGARTDWISGSGNFCAAGCGREPAD